MAQRYKTFIEIGIIDNGISIPGSYENKGFNFNNVEALEKALKGLSTKRIERGFGLSSSLKLLTEGFEVNCFIVSRGAGLFADKNNYFFYNMEEKNVFNGILIITRFLI